MPRLCLRTAPEGRLSGWRLQVLWLVAAIALVIYCTIVGAGVYDRSPAVSASPLSILLVLGLVAIAIVLGMLIEDQTISLAPEAREWLTALPRFQKDASSDQQHKWTRLWSRGTIDVAEVQLGFVLILVLGVVSRAAWRGDGELFWGGIDWRVLLALSEIIYLVYGISTLAAKRELEAIAIAAAKFEAPGKRSIPQEELEQVEPKEHNRLSLVAVEPIIDPVPSSQ